MTRSQYFDLALRAMISAASIAVLFLPFGEILIGTSQPLTMASDWLLVFVIPFPAVATLAMISPLIPKLSRHLRLIDSLTALFALIAVIATAIYILMMGLGFIIIFFFLMAFLLPLFIDMGLFLQAGSWLLMVAFILALVQMIRANTAPRSGVHV